MFCLLLRLSAGAQNLVPNPSFETYNNCPTSLSGIAYTPAYNVFNTARFWVSPLLNTTPDYFNGCAGTQALMGIPKNAFGNKQTRNGGNAYAGIVAWEGQYIGQPQLQDYREYIETKLANPLVAGRKYCIYFFVSPAILANTPFNYVSIDDIGAKLSTTQITNTTDKFLAMTPDVRNPQGNFLSDTSKWYKVQGIYMAQGGEQWLTIGSFNSTNSLPVHNQLYPSTTIPNANKRIYLFIDDVSVQEIVTKDSIFNTIDTSICFSQGNFAAASSMPADDYVWDNGLTTQTRIIDSAGIYWRRSTRDCVVYVDSFRVEERDDLPLIIVGDTISCNNQPIKLTTTNKFEIYHWSNGDTGDTALVTQSGIISLSAEDACGLKKRQVTVTIRDSVPPPHVTDTAVCQFAENVVLSVTGTNLTWYNYQLDIHGIKQQPAVYTGVPDSLVFYVTSTSGGCESARTPVSVKVIYKPELSLASEYLFCEKDLQVIGKQYPDVTYAWSTGDDVCCISPSNSGNYTLTIYNNCGIASQSTYVDIDPCEECVLVPNVFTPNNDGQNDAFQVKINCEIRNFKLAIYNRWGAEVFSTNTAQEGWDGRTDGAENVTEVYVYILEYTTENGRQYKRKGNLTLLR